MTDEVERAAFREKLRSIQFGGIKGEKARSKTTVDRHDHHEVHVREYGSDQQDVSVKLLEPIKVKAPKVNGA